MQNLFIFVMPLECFGCEKDHTWAQTAYFYGVNNSSVVFESNFSPLHVDRKY